MALIRCAECKKEVSSSAVSCPHCGFVLGSGSGSAGNAAFERRIEEYKNAGYILEKRSGDSVNMLKMSKGKGWLWFFIMFFPAFFALMGIISPFVYGFSFGFVFVFICICITFTAILIYRDSLKKIRVNIYISQTRQIVETGNVLKNK